MEASPFETTSRYMIRMIDNIPYLLCVQVPYVLCGCGLFANKTEKPKPKPKPEVKIIDEFPLPTIKRCKYCRQIDHNISKCELIEIEISKIPQYCSVNINDIPNVRDYLTQTNKIVLERYVTKSNLLNYMRHNCSVYYDNNIYNAKNSHLKNVELVIGYLCVLPFHPEIKIQRQYKHRINKHKVIEAYPYPKQNNQRSFGITGFTPCVEMGVGGVGIGFAMPI